MPKVSIIVPVYNVEKYLPRCIDSILNQTFSDFELILVDDGSPDNCGAICDEYVAKDSRVVVIHKENGGVSSARNAGLSVAIGSHILFIDSDDYVENTYVASLIDNQSDLTCCGFVAEDELGQKLYAHKHSYIYYPTGASIDYAKLYERNVLYSPYCKLLKNSVIQKNNLRFPEGITWGEDGMFIADYLQFVQSLTVLEYTGYHYVKYKSENSLSTKVRKDVVAMVGMSRGYCIEKMKTTCPEAAESVERICTNDMYMNGAYFVTKLLGNVLLSKRNKIRILKQYMQSAYILETFSPPFSFYPANVAFSVSLSKKTASAIVRAYTFEIYKQNTIQYLYNQVFTPLPDFLKYPIRLIWKRVRR